MTKLDIFQIEPIPGFDSLQWKRERQAEIYEETKSMTPKEQRERLRKNSEKFWAEIERRRAEMAAQAQT